MVTEASNKLWERAAYIVMASVVATLCFGIWWAAGGAKPRDEDLRRQHMEALASEPERTPSPLVAQFAAPRKAPDVGQSDAGERALPNPSGDPPGARSSKAPGQLARQRQPVVVPSVDRKPMPPPATVVQTVSPIPEPAPPAEPEVTPSSPEPESGEAPPGLGGSSQ